VFGSNLAGRHGKGAALTAKLRHGATQGQGEGLQGQSYGIPTKGGEKTGTLSLLPLHQIEWHVLRFVEFARDHPHLLFFVTRIGCGLAGFRDDQIAPFFRDAPANCLLPDRWRRA
jgi:hypothetical protein